jgi:hypothetical protein
MCITTIMHQISKPPPSPTALISPTSIIASSVSQMSIPVSTLTRFTRSSHEWHTLSMVLEVIFPDKCSSLACVAKSSTVSGIDSEGGKILPGNFRWKKKERLSSLSSLYQDLTAGD